VRLMENYILGKKSRGKQIDFVKLSATIFRTKKLFKPAGRARQAAKTKMPPQSESVEAAGRRVEKLILTQMTRISVSYE
jgi:hypothetical protein